MNNVFEFTVTNKSEYKLWFQDMEYTKNDFERFYSNVAGMETEIEFLPGIFYEFEIKRSILLKHMLAVLHPYEGESKFINALSDFLTVNEYDGRYVIVNGNHRACCAKVFGIPFVKAKIYRHRRTDGPCKKSR